MFIDEKTAERIVLNVSERISASWRSVAGDTVPAGMFEGGAAENSRAAAGFAGGADWLADGLGDSSGNELAAWPADLSTDLSSIGGDCVSSVSPSAVGELEVSMLRRPNISSPSVWAAVAHTTVWMSALALRCP
jgi:hypothetical protein